MRKILIALASTVLFCGATAPPPYDIAGLPDAAAAREKGLLACQVRTFGTISAQVECGLAAHRLYAVTEKLQPMSLFRDYADGARKAAAAADKGQLSLPDLQQKLAALRTAYDGAVAKLYADYKAANPRAGLPFDRTAWPAAARTRDQAVAACGAWDSVNTISVRLTCVLAADKAFTTTIALKDMDLFYGYASFLKVDAVDAQAGRFQPAQLGQRHAALWNDFLLTLDHDYTNWKGGGH